MEGLLSEAFVQRVSELARTVDSRIIIALDPTFNPYRFKRQDERSKEKLNVRTHVQNLLSELNGLIAGVKMGLPIMLGLGPDQVEDILKPYTKSYFFICDLKTADIGYINRLVAEQVFELGFDALIIHAVIGTKGGLDEVIKLAGEMDRGVLAVCAMSHPGAEEHLNKHFGALLALAASAGADGFVLPATFPQLITRARKKYPQAMLFSPGVGVQGAPFGSAIAAGSDFEIIGRAIAGAPSPAQKAREIKEVIGRKQT